MTHAEEHGQGAIRLAVQTLLLPGDSLEQQFANARRYGFDAVELCVGPQFDMLARLADVQHAMAATGVPVAAICTHPMHDPMEGDADEQRWRVLALAELIDLASSLGAAGVVSVPVRSRQHLEHVRSLDDAQAAMTERVIDALTQLADTLSAGDACLFLEPLNRYESWYLNRVDQAVDLACRTRRPRVKALADVFHMNIEEADLGDSLRQAGSTLGHVHVADNNRLEPGAGCLDFCAVFKGLHDINYTGYVSLECFSPAGPRVSGDPEVSLPATVAYLRNAWVEALVRAM